MGGAACPNHLRRPALSNLDKRCATRNRGKVIFKPFLYGAQVVAVAPRTTPSTALSSWGPASWQRENIWSWAWVRWLFVLMSLFSLLPHPHLFCFFSPPFLILSAGLSCTGVVPSSFDRALIWIEFLGLSPELPGLTSAFPYCWPVCFVSL